MEDRLNMSIFLDLYGVLLTEKQRDILDLYYNNDLSLAEIAENMSISRQAVFDIIKRCHKLLTEYESKLNLMENENIRENRKNELIRMLDTVLAYGDSREDILKIKSFVVNNL
ncbi:MAG: putative DNA-binding protein [Clostridiaceae bacterium]